MISPEAEIVKQGDEPNEKMYFVQKGKFRVKVSLDAQQ